MNLKIEISELELKKLIVAELKTRLGEVTFEPDNVQIEVKSKQNYRAEWEQANFRATLTVNN